MRPVLMAEYADGKTMLAALRRLRETGFVPVEAWTPYPVHGSEELLKLPRSPVPLAALVAGLTGAVVAYLIQWGTNAWDYPLNVGGRPAHAWPAFVPIVFETAVLFAAVTTLLSTFAFSRLPRLWSPEFEIDGFERASIDRYWVGISTLREDGKPVDAARLAADLTQAGALRVVPLGTGS